MSIANHIDNLMEQRQY